MTGATDMESDQKLMAFFKQQQWKKRVISLYLMVVKLFGYPLLTRKWKVFGMIHILVITFRLSIQTGDQGNQMEKGLKTAWKWL